MRIQNHQLAQTHRTCCVFSFQIDHAESQTLLGISFHPHDSRALGIFIMPVVIQKWHCETAYIYYERQLTTNTVLSMADKTVQGKTNYTDIITNLPQNRLSISTSSHTNIRPPDFPFIFYYSYCLCRSPLVMHGMS